MPDSRQRAPFPHQSSSADFGSRQPPPLRTSNQTQQSWDLMSPNSYGSAISGTARTPTGINSTWAPFVTRKASGDGRDVSSNVYSLSAHQPQSFSLNTPPHTRSLSLPASVANLPLPSLSTVRFVLLCSLWYFSSALSSNTGKVILNHFKYPVTLTIVQFFFVATYCYFGSRRQLNWTGRLRKPTRAILTSTTPMAVFQVGGHIFSSLAISRVPVSTVHTIKALSPLFTVFAYALLFGVSYSPATYLSLLPLTLGVMLACSFDMTVSNALGLVCAFGSTLVFVSSNIVFKKLMPSSSEGSSSSARLDKINLLFYSSGMAFILMIPIWLYSDVPSLIHLWSNPIVRSSTAPSVTLYFFLNGTVHFAQNLLAFAILSSTSPVTYSIASLVKRIAVICLAIVWFKQSVHPIQAVGIALTAVGLWMYNNAKRDVEIGEKKMRQVEAVREGMLPTTKGDQQILEGVPSTENGVGLGFSMREKEAHHSPKPSYSGYEPPISVSSAIRNYPTARPGPPGYIAKPYEPAIEGPYPSPPASTSSSPPSHPINPPQPVQPIQLPPAPHTTRYRRLSNANPSDSAPNDPYQNSSTRPLAIDERGEDGFRSGMEHSPTVLAGAA